MAAAKAMTDNDRMATGRSTRMSDTPQAATVPRKLYPVSKKSKRLAFEARHEPIDAPRERRSPLLHGRGKVPVHGAKPGISLGIKSQAGSIQYFAVEDHRLDLACIADA